ncbi:EAL domain-containing protein [Aquibacillus rhizosphaerae]|uniref:EAL domain-containing protein n=1 Tax=Aquibacillus rhizosphaerae TaxID=3051431 RepID=A0ABT7L2W8_9BACI|nr:EAL domain-containing protein [Aquibacillus sp. LR5S19]MDL4840210.1 EAL domain-containing protein [Aquibacillus sp. LR5S19]
MNVFNKLVPRYRELFLFITLMTLLFLSVRFHINFMYGLTINLASIFLFLVLRLFGLRWAILAGILGLIFVPQDIVPIAIHIILITEIIFVGLFFTKGKAAKMFFVDALFWGTVGFITILFLHKTYLSGNSLYFQICIDIINGLFNVLIADMLLAYFPFYKMIKNRLNKNNVSIHQFLTHITLISILVPFLLSVTMNTIQLNKFISTYLVNVAETSVNQMENELSLWDSTDITKALAYKGQQLEQMQELIKRHQTNEFDVYITDGEHDLLVSSEEVFTLSQMKNSHQEYRINELTSEVIAALPDAKDGLPPIQRWNNGQYIYEQSIDSLPIKLVFQFPIAQFQTLIYSNFLNQLKYSLVFVLCLVILVTVVSRIFMNNLRQLTIATTGLPQKLHNLEKVQWPQIYISELRILTQNLMMMADKIKDLFHESKRMNIKLTNQTKKLKKSEDTLHELAYYDVLTQLPNRLHFQDYVKNLIKLDSSPCFAVIFIDLNRFKQINDTFGHDAGDKLLQLIANKLSELHIDQQREVFRLGGDEFVIVDTVRNQREVSCSLDTIFQEFVDPFVLEEQTLFIVPSVGVSMYPQDGEDLDTLVKCADTAMYISKDKGGNVAQFFNESMKNRFQKQLIIENALRQVVDNGCGFELFYQPKTKFSNVSSMEALIRWYHPELGTVSPATFIPIAEENGLILQIDEWSLRQACKQNKKWQDQGLLKVPVAVNISAKHFQQDLLVTLIDNVLNESGMDPKYLKLEITESVFIRNPQHVSSVIQKLKSLGVHISIDDFGKGYSSLNHLLELPIDEVKIDRMFIEGIDGNQKKALLVNSIFNIADGLNLNVVAEGVETEREKATLEEIGPVELQGYLFSPPVNKQEMENFLSCEKNYSQP